MITIKTDFSEIIHGYRTRFHYLEIYQPSYDGKYIEELKQYYNIFQTIIVKLNQYYNIF